jgi:SAM-dependent methyltransferase
MSSYVKSIVNFQRMIDERNKLTLAAIDACREVGDDALPPADLMSYIGSNNVSHFRSNMEYFFKELVSRFNLDSSSCILDLGCGCGRMAFPFINFLVNGKYIGLDVWEKGIDWCKKNFNHPNAEFVCLASKNNYYDNQARSDVKNKYSLAAIEDRTVDLLFATSVFTHLTWDDAALYFEDMKRVLRPGGCAYITCFKLDRFFYSYSEKTGDFIDIKEDEINAGCFYGYSGQDFFAGHSPESLKKLIELSGLELISFELGSWAAKPSATHYQDLIVLCKN